MVRRALTARKEQFCLYVIQGMTKSDAYRKAFPASRATSKSINEAACKLAARQEIRDRIGDLLREVDAESIIGLGEHLHTLRERSDHCWREDQKTIAERYDKQIGAWLARFKDAEREDKQDRDWETNGLVRWYR